jgi:hypothetical protein
VDQGPPRDQFSTTPREQANLWELCYTHAWKAPTRLQIYLLGTHQRLPASLKLNTCCTQKMTRVLIPAASTTSVGRTGSTSTLPCAVTTRLPAAAALPQLRRTTGCLGTSRGSSLTTSPTRNSSSTTSPRAARRATRRRLLCLAQACHRLLCLRRVSGCHGTSRGSSSTTSPTPRDRVPQHVARLVTRLVVDYFAYTAHQGVSAHRADCRVARRRLLRLA